MIDTSIAIVKSLSGQTAHKIVLLRAVGEIRQWILIEISHRDRVEPDIDHVAREWVAGVWIEDRDRLADTGEARVEQLAEIALAHSGRRHGYPAALIFGQTLTQTLVVGKEEGLIFLDRPTKGEAKLIALKYRFGWGKGSLGIKLGIAQQFE